MKTRKISDRSLAGSIIAVLRYKLIRRAAKHCLKTVIKHFFLAQYKAALGITKKPVYQVDHVLDKKIPFIPSKVSVYLNFTGFWIRALAFIMQRYSNRKEVSVIGAEFVDSIAALYKFAAKVYRHKLSTTQRPRYLKKIKFILIHLLDPHLMCIPSLHVMIVIRCYTKFRETAERFGDLDELAEYVEELKTGALAVTESVLFVKQHSINCIPSALYAVYKMDNSLFSYKEALEFIEDLFINDTGFIDNPAEIRACIRSLFISFTEADPVSMDWRSPLFDFLENNRVVAGQDFS